MISDIFLFLNVHLERYVSNLPRLLPLLLSVPPRNHLVLFLHLLGFPAFIVSAQFFQLLTLCDKSDPTSRHFSLLLNYADN